MADYSTITSDPSVFPTEEPPEADLSAGGYSAPVNPSDIEEARQIDLSAPTAPIRPEDIEVQRQIDFHSQPVPSDEEAAQLYQRLPFLPDEERPSALNTLNRYAADLEEKEAVARKTERAYEFTNPEARKAWLNQKDVKENLGYLEDSNAAFDRMAVKKFFEKDIAKRPLSDPEYEAMRNDYARRMAGKPKVSDQEAFGIVQKEEEIRQQFDAAIDFVGSEMLSKKVEAGMTGKPFSRGDVWDAARKKFPEAISTMHMEDLLYKATQEVDAKQQALLGESLPAVGVLGNYMVKLAGVGVPGIDQPTPEETQAFVETAAQIDPRKLKDVLMTVAAGIKNKQIDKALVTKFWHNATRDVRTLMGVKDPIRAMGYGAAIAEIEARKAALEGGSVRIDEEGNIVWFQEKPSTYTTQLPEEKAGLRKLNAEEKAKAFKTLEQLDRLATIDATVQQVFDSTLGARDDYFSETFLGGKARWVEQQFFAARDQAPQMLMAGLATPLYFATVGSQSFRQIKIDNPTIDNGVAVLMATTEAGVNWIGDRAQIKGLQGLGPVRALMSSVRGGAIGRGIVRGVGMLGYETATEYAQDWFSGVGKKAMQEIVRAINPDADVGKVATFNEINDEFVKNLGPTAMQMFFLTAAGAGVITYRDVKDPQSSIYSVDKLKSLGIRDDDITTLLYEDDFGERGRMLEALTATRTPEQVNNGILYAQELAEAERAKIAGATPEEQAEAAAAEEEAFKEPRLEPHEQPDGTRKFTLYDGNGTVVRENMDEGVAATEYNDLLRQSFGEHMAKQVEARASEQAVAKEVAAEAKWNILDAKERTTLGNILEYSHVKHTPEQQKTVTGLRAALARSGRKDDDPVIVSMDSPTTRAGRGVTNFIGWYEKTFGKQVVFVASESGKPLSFDGLINPADPNTIFLNAAGNRNVLSLLGHEWSHTLEKTNPKLWKDVVERMRPLIVDWAKQLGKIDKSYDADQATPEFIANIIGDAFGDPEFWKVVRARDFGTFQRLLASIKEWFDTIIEHATEWGTPEVIKDLKGIREIIADAMERAEVGPEIMPPGEITPEMNTALKAIGFSDAMIAGLTPTQAFYYLQPPAAQLSVRVHHGTKTKGIAEWLLEKIGSGEGHAMMGWGIYVAEHPDVGRRYRKMLGGEEEVKMADRDIYDPANPRHVASHWLHLYKEDTLGREAAATSAIKGWENVRDIMKPGMVAVNSAAIDILRKAVDPNNLEAGLSHLPSYRVERHVGGELYTLDMDIARGEALDLDRRMDDQSPVVMEKIEASGIDYDPDNTGEEFQIMLWDRYEKQIMNEPRFFEDYPYGSVGAKKLEFEFKRRVSMWLKSIGIPANVFADGFSRKVWQSRLHDYYEQLFALQEDLRNYQRYTQGGVALSEAVDGIQQEIEDLKDAILQEEKTEKITYNWVLWEPERLKNAPEGERLKFAAPRESGHKFGKRGARIVDENGGYVTDAELLKVDASINAQLDKKGIKGKARQRIFEKAREDIRTDIQSARARNPDVTTGTPDPWDTMEVTGSKLEFKEKDVTKSVAMWKKIPYKFDQIPDGMTREQWRNELSNRVMAQFIERLQKGNRPDATPEERAGAELILREIEWYRDFVHKLRQDFGGAADFMADLLGAFSPRQNVRLNVRNAIDAIWAINTGKYDQLFKELDAYLKADPTHTIGTWRKEEKGAMMSARSGNLFGTNTERGMYAALGLWREIRAGDKPKAKNFTRNLIGLSIKATIDVWAARLLDRVAGKPRIPVDAEGAVAGAHLTEAQIRKRYGEEVPEDIPVTGQFAFGQEVFARVADLMKDPATWVNAGLSQKVIDAFKAVTPADVQAMNWFVEKEVWTENDWTNEEGAGGSFMHEIEQHLGTRFQVGLSQEMTTFKPQDPDQARFIQEVHDDLVKIMPEVLALRVMDSLGMFKGTRERTLDLEFTTSPGMEPNDLMRVVLYHAWSKDQDATHISRVKEDWEEDDPNDRPGIEVYLKAGSDISALEPVFKALQKRRLNGFTMIVDPRAKMGSGEYLGIRFQYVPEYSGDGPEWAQRSKQVEATITRAVEVIKGISDVSHAKLVWYDTLVFQKGHDYDDQGQNPGAVGTVEARAWRKRYFDYMAQKAVRRDERETLLEKQHPDEALHRQQATVEARPTGLAPPGAPVEINTFDRDAKGFVSTPTKPTKELLKQLNIEQRTYEQLLQCLA